jgi:hypothetical protein
VVSFTPRPLYPQGKNPRYPLDRRLGRPQSRSGRGEERKDTEQKDSFLQKHCIIYENMALFTSKLNSGLFSRIRKYIKEDEMDEECSTHVRVQKCMQGFSWKSRNEDAYFKIRGLNVFIGG